MSGRRAHPAAASDGSETAGTALAAHWWVFAVRGSMSMAFGAVVLFLPGLGRLLLGQMLVAHLLAGGALVLVASRRAPAGGEEPPAPFRLEAALGIAAGVAVGELGPWFKSAVVPTVAAWATATGALALAGALQLEARHGRTALALSAVVSILSGAALLVVWGALASLPDGGAWPLEVPASGQVAAALGVWFPGHAVLSGAGQLALALRLSRAAPALPPGARVADLALATGALGVVLAGVASGLVVVSGGALLALGVAPVLRRRGAGAPAAAQGRSGRPWR